MAKVYQQRRGTAANLAAENAVYESGQRITETDTGLAKFADGVTAYIDLPYEGINAATASKLVDLITTDQESINQIANILRPLLNIPPPTPPVIQGVPTLSGTPTVPNIITVTPATVVGENITNTFQLERDGTPIDGATGLVYQLTNDDADTDLTVVQLSTDGNGLTDTAESAPLAIDALADTVAPTIGTSITNITSTTVTVNTTASEISTHYVIRVPQGSTTPTDDQVIAGVDYGAVTGVAAQSGSGTVTNLTFTGLTPETAYDFHAVAVDFAPNKSTLSSELNVITDSEEDYEPIPFPPAFNDTFLLDPAVVGPTIEIGDLNGKRDLLLPLNFGQPLILNNIQGTATNKYRIKSESDTVRSWVDGTLLNQGQQAVRGGSGGGYSHFEIFHIGIKCNPNPLIGGISGLTISARSDGTHLLMDDVIIIDTSFAGLHINGETTGNYYESLTFNNLRIIGHPQEGEMAYLGSTHKILNISNINNLTIRNLYGAEKGRELQLTHCLNFLLSKGTCYNQGQSNIPGQRNLVQIHNSVGRIEYYIFDMAPDFLNNFCHGVTFYRCYFRWSGAYGGLQGKLRGTASVPAFGPSAAGANNQPNIYQECTFDPINNVTWMRDIREDECDDKYIDCAFSTRIANAHLDNRTDKLSFSLSETGSTFFAPGAGTIPTYENHDWQQEQTHGLVNSVYHKSLGMGYRVKDPSEAPVIVTPSTQGSSLVASGVTDTSITINMTRGDGDGVIILMKAGGAVDSLPVDLTNYSADAVFGSGTQLGTGNYVVHKGAGSVVITGLTPSTTYHIRACEYNGSGVTSKFLNTTATNNPISQATDAAAAFDPESIAWNYAVYAEDSPDLATTGIIINRGTSGNGSIGFGTPTYEVADLAFDFDRPQGDFITIPQGSVSNAIHGFWRLKITSLASVDHSPISLGANSRAIRVTSDGSLVVCGQDTGVNLIENTFYVIRVSITGGTALVVSVDSGSDFTAAITSVNLGSNGRFGVNNNGTEGSNSRLTHGFVKRSALTAGEISNMKTYLLAI